MKSFFVKAFVSEKNGEVVLNTLTRTDARNLLSFLEECKDKPLSVEIKDTSAGKTYEQLKTIYALSSIIYETMFFRRPTDSENHAFVNDLITSFGEKRVSILDPEKLVSIPLKELNKYQLSELIYKIANFLVEMCQLPPRLDIDVRELFIEWQDWRSSQRRDIADMNEEGNYLSLMEWKERNNFSFATGKSAFYEPLEVAHIVSRGADKEDIDEVWNLMMLTHYEHIEIMHKKGWNAFLRLYPHLRGRVERARELAGKLKLV